MQLDIELGKHVGVEDACFRYVPDSSGFYNVPNDKLLDGLILGHAPGAVRAANGLHMAAALFGTTVVSSFFGHLGAKTRKRGFSIFISYEYCQLTLRNIVSIYNPISRTIRMLTLESLHACNTNIQSLRRTQDLRSARVTKLDPVIKKSQHTLGCQIKCRMLLNLNFR